MLPPVNCISQPGRKAVPGDFFSGVDLGDPTHRGRQNQMDRSMLCRRSLVNLLSQEHSWLLSRHLCVCSYTPNIGANGARFFPWGADALWQSTCLRIHPLRLPLPSQRSHCCGPWQFGKKRTLTLHKVGPCPSLKGNARAELRPIRRQSSLIYSRSLLLHGK